LVPWPAGSQRRAELATRGVPRLLVVADGITPPPMGQGEDWIRASANERDAWARLRRLAARHERRSDPRMPGRSEDDRSEERPCPIS
jgi:hypothetical protein